MEDINFNCESETSSNLKKKKMASYLHRTAQPRTLAAFPPWGSLQELVV